MEEINKVDVLREADLLENVLPKAGANNMGRNESNLLFLRSGLILASTETCKSSLNNNILIF
jgi:hypothetical protein